MPLNLIEKYPAHTDGELFQIKKKGVLTTQEKDLLGRFFVLNDLMSPEEKKVLHTLCRSIHERDLWIQCDCLDGVIKPVFRINRASSGNLYLHRITSRAEHTDSCLFKERVYESHDRESDTRKPLVKKDLPFNLLGNKSHGLLKPSEDKSSQRSKEGAGQSKLATALFHLLEEAHLNTVSITNRSKPQDALLHAATSIELMKGLPLANYLTLNPNRVKYSALRLKEDTAWDPKVEKHCLALLHVKSFNEHSLEVIFPDKSTKNMSIATRIYQSSGRFSERTAPYMAFVLIGTTAKASWFYEPVKAYVMPTYSDVSYFPVDSFYEREVMRHLYRLYFDEMNKGHPFQIMKPLFDMEVMQEDNEDCPLVLPDFLIQKGKKTLVIEVNGSMDPVYLARKARVYDHMKHLGELLSINAYQAEAEKKLHQEIMSLMKEITAWLRVH